MEYDSFNTAHEYDCFMLGFALRDETCKIRKITVVPHGVGDNVYIFYEPKDELVKNETERVSELRNIAQELTENAVYGKLTNAKQRNLYLCEYCHISKADAEDIVELVKIIEVEASVTKEKKEKSKFGIMMEENKKLESQEKERIHKKEVSK